MPAYTEIQFKNLSVENSELLMALLSDIGFEGFEETGEELKAFIQTASFNEVEVEQIATQLKTSFVKMSIEETNWNQVWESNFEPVMVDDFVALRADFHAPINSVMHEIIITPKMSFGTGHHATTYMMLQQMREIDFKGKKVFDFGTGTGVLAILAEKLGASRVLAVDNDDWSIENAKENLERNGSRLIETKKADSADMKERFDIILANINKNVLLSSMEMMAESLSTPGVLLLSGILGEDISEILSETENLGLKFIHKTARSNWLVLKLSY